MAKKRFEIERHPDGRLWWGNTSRDPRSSEWVAMKDNDTGLFLTGSGTWKSTHTWFWDEIEADAVLSLNSNHHATMKN